MFWDMQRFSSRQFYIFANFVQHLWNSDPKDRQCFNETDLKTGVYFHNNSFFFLENTLKAVLLKVQ